MSNDVDLKRGIKDISFSINGTQFLVDEDSLTIIAPDEAKIIVSGDNYDLLKQAIGRQLPPEFVLGKPLIGISGEKIFVGIR